MRKRIVYTKDLDKKELVSEELVSERNGGIYRVHISLEEITVKIKNIRSRYIVKKSKELTNINYAKQLAKKWIKGLGVPFGVEVHSKPNKD